MREQTALRHIATLIAQGVPPAAVFDAVTTELGRVLGVQCSALCRYEADETGEIKIRPLSTWNAPGEPSIAPASGSLWALPGSVSERVLRSGRPERTTYETATVGIAALSRALDVKSGIGSPIIVAGRLWGLSIILSRSPEPFPADTEARMSQFVELCAVAVEIAESRAELMASRSRIVEAADTARRRIERDLHDGVQQRLISLGLDLRLAESAVPDELTDLKKQIAYSAQNAARIHDEVREIAHGVYPALLSHEGLISALRTLARRSSVPVRLDVRHDRPLPEHVEMTVYYIVSEALANAAKHSNASEVSVALAVEDSCLRLTVSDDGVGGATLRRGSGLVGLSDRVEAHGGRLEVISPEGRGTTLTVEIPIGSHDDVALPAREPQL